MFKSLMRENEIAIEYASILEEYARDLRNVYTKRLRLHIGAPALNCLIFFIKFYFLSPEFFFCILQNFYLRAVSPAKNRGQMKRGKNSFV